MAALASGIFSHSMTAAQALANTGSAPLSASPADSSGTSASSTNSATISANDFLTLLVTEMQNQDPTANTDPNEYINQLVNVNSLEQLIDINQNLSTALGSSPSSSATPAIAKAASPALQQATTDTAKSASSAAQSIPSSTGAAGKFAALASAVKRAPGNLSVPDAQPAANTVAHALGGRPRAQSISSGFYGSR